MILNNIKTTLPIGCNQLCSYLNSSVLVNREISVPKPMMASVCIIKNIGKCKRDWQQFKILGNLASHKPKARETLMAKK